MYTNIYPETIFRKQSWEGLMADLHLTSQIRKTYAKPAITEVRLVAQQAVLGDCKIGSGVKETNCPLNLTCSLGSTS
jgi:hypothetical protein